MHKRRRRDPWLKLFLCNFFLLLKSTWSITFLNVNQTMQEFFRKFGHKYIIERSAYFSVEKNNKISLDLFLICYVNVNRGRMGRNNKCGGNLRGYSNLVPPSNKCTKSLPSTFRIFEICCPSTFFGTGRKVELVISYICLRIGTNWK